MVFDSIAQIKVISEHYVLTDRAEPQIRKL